MIKRLLEMLPRWYRARITVRGLVIRNQSKAPTELQDRVFEWKTLKSQSSTIWKPYDDEDQEIRVNGRSIRLILWDSREHSLICKLRRRAFERNWRDGTLDMTLHFGDHIRELYQFRIVASILTLALFGLISYLVFSNGLPKITWPTGLMPDHIVVANVFALTGMGLLFFGPLIAVLCMAFQPLKQTASSIHITNESCKVERFDGLNFLHTWSDLISIKKGSLRNMCLEFVNGDKVVLQPNSTLHQLVNHLSQHYLNDQTDSSKGTAYLRRVALRVTIIVIPLGIISAWFMTTYFYNEFADLGYVGSFWGLTLLLSIPIPAMCWILLWLEGVKWKRLRYLYRRWRRVLVGSKAKRRLSDDI